MKTILITGASSGIGRALAVRAARAGFAVYAVGRNASALAALATQVADEGNTIETDVTDVGEPGNAPAIIARAVGVFGHIDVLVNNAGAAAAGPIVAQSNAALREQFGTHVIGPLALVREALVSLRTAHGQVFMIGSGVARVPIPGMGAYPPSKAALRSATTILRRELAPLGVAVTYVDPGAVATIFMTRAGMAGAPASVLISPELVARKIMVAIGTRPNVLNVAPLQTAAVAVAELLPKLTELVLARNPNLLGTAPQTLGLRDRNGHVEARMLTANDADDVDTIDAEEPSADEVAAAAVGVVFAAAATTEPPASVDVEPVAAESAVAEPEVAEPEATEPEAAAAAPEAAVAAPPEPEVAEPEAAEPEAAEPEAAVAEPEAAEPEAAAAAPEAAVAEPVESEAAEPEVAEPAATVLEAAEPEFAEPEAAEPETVAVDAEVAGETIVDVPAEPAGEDAAEPDGWAAAIEAVPASAAAEPGAAEPAAATSDATEPAGTVAVDELHRNEAGSADALADEADEDEAVPAEALAVAAVEPAASDESTIVAWSSDAPSPDAPAEPAATSEPAAEAPGVIVAEFPADEPIAAVPEPTDAAPDPIAAAPDPIAAEPEPPAMRWTYEPPEADDALPATPVPAAASAPPDPAHAVTTFRETAPRVSEPEPAVEPEPAAVPPPTTAVVETVAEDVPPAGADDGPSVAHDDEPARTTSSFDAAIEPLRRRMERARLDPAFVRGLLVPDAELDVGEAAMRWAGMPNKNERALTGEVFFALAEWGFLTPRADGRYRVVRSADEPAR